MLKRGTHKSWLKSCPANDGNFKAHLKQATDGEIKELIAELPEQGNKAKIAKLKTELRRRQKADRDKAILFCHMVYAREKLLTSLSEEIIKKSERKN